MANVKSQSITDKDNFIAVPVVRDRGRQKSSDESVTFTATDPAITEFARMVRLRSNDVVHHIWVNIDSDASLSIDVGLLRPGSDVDGDFVAYAGGIAAAAGALTAPGVDLLTAAGANRGNVRSQPVYKDADGALTEDPGGEYDLVIRADAAATGSPVVTVNVEYSAND